MVQVKLPDGSALEIAKGTTAKELAQQLGSELANAAVAAKVNGLLVDLATPINNNASHRGRFLL